MIVFFTFVRVFDTDFMQKKRILICLDKLKNLHCGLGQVSYHFGKEILEKSPDDFEITFLLPKKGFELFEKETSCVRLKFFRRYFPLYMRKFDICHIPYQLPSYRFFGAKKNVMTIHDLNFIFTKNPAKSKKYLRKLQRNIECVDALVFISEFTRKTAYEHLRIPEKMPTSVIYNGVFAPQKSEDYPTDLSGKKFLFSIGQFFEKKNFHVLLPFIQDFPEDIILVIAGQNDTAYGNQMRQEIKELGLEKKVLLLGRISETQKGYLFHHCEAFLFPSIAEGFGLPVIEAMLCRKPVFCSHRTGLTEIGDKYAFFWHDFSPENMKKTYVEGMKKAAEEKFLDAQQAYAQTYTYEKNVAEYIRLYQQLSEDSPGALKK